LTQGPQCEGTKLWGLGRKIQRLGRQGILTIHADKDVKRPQNREDKLTIAREARPRKMGPKWAKNPLGRPPLVDRPNPFSWRFEPPFGLGLLRGINSLAAKIRRHPSTGTQRNLGESDDGRRKSSKSSRKGGVPELVEVINGMYSVEMI
jgi:hypothetical protein